MSAKDRQQDNNQPKSKSNPSDHTSMMSRMRSGFKRYWFVAVPALMLNIGITLDHVIAKNNENVFRVMINRSNVEALNAVNQEQDAPLNETLQAHWIKTNDEGNVEGRISTIEPTQSVTIPIEQLDVTLLQDGETIRESSTDSDGKFILKDVDPGVYTLVAAGQNGFLAYGVNILPKLQEFDVLNKKTQLDAKSRNAFYVSHYKLPQDTVVMEELQIDAAAIPPEFNTLERISENYLPAEAAFDVEKDRDDAKAVAKAQKISGGFKFPLTAEGGFEGRIQPIATGDGEPAKLNQMNIFLIQDDIEITRVSVEETGKFTVEDVEPGVYSLVAAGQDGFAALSLELVGGALQLESSQTGKTKATYVSNVDPNKRAVLGIAIESNRKNLARIRQIIRRIAEQQRQMVQNLDDPFAGDGMFNGVPRSISSSGFPPGALPGGGFPGTFGPGFSAPPVVSPPVQFGSSFPRATGGIFSGNGNGLAIAALTTGIVALATDNDRVVTPPNMTVFAPADITGN